MVAFLCRERMQLCYTISLQHIVLLFSVRPKCFHDWLHICAPFEEIFANIAHTPNSIHNNSGCSPTNYKRMVFLISDELQKKIREQKHQG